MIVFASNVAGERFGPAVLVHAATDAFVLDYQTRVDLALGEITEVRGATSGPGAQALRLSHVYEPVRR